MASREALEDWTQRWLKANQDAEAAGDWKPLADFYTEDSTYGWNIGPKEDVMCVGREEIRNVALGLEMDASAYGMGTRSKRFALYAEDGVVKQLHVESPGEFRVSSADYVLEHLPA